VDKLFPMFVKLTGRQILVVGAGTVAEAKIAGLLNTGAIIRVVAFAATEIVQGWADSGQIRLEFRSFTVSDLEEAFAVIVATGSQEIDEFVFLEAQARGVLCNVVDVPELCDFYYPAVVQRGDLQIAISTSGQSPSLAQKIRLQLERQFGPGYAEWVARLGETRREILSTGLDPERKRFLLQSLADREALHAMLADVTPAEAEGEAA